MPTVIQCACGRQVAIPDEARGQALACPYCKTRLPAPPVSVTARPPLPPPANPPGPAPTPVPQDLGRVVVAYSASDLRDNDNFVVLTETAFCIASLPRTALNQVKGLLEDGTPVRQVLGTTARIIPLNAVQAVQCSNKDLTLSLGYLDGSRRAETTVQYVGIGFQETFAALRKQLGPGWHETAKPSTPWSAMTLPLVVLGVLLVFIGLAFGATLQDEAGMVFMRRGKKVLGRGIAGWLPSYGWLIVGALVIAACLLWLVYAVRNRPPAAVQITRSPE